MQSAAFYPSSAYNFEVAARYLRTLCLYLHSPLRFHGVHKDNLAFTFQCHDNSCTSVILRRIQYSFLFTHVFLLFRQIQDSCGVRFQRLAFTILINLYVWTLRLRRWLVIFWGQRRFKPWTFQTPVLTVSAHIFINSFSILSDDRFKASPKTIPPHSAI
jgi:hypothetical protein